jgi:hypothetical protein
MYSLLRYLTAAIRQAPEKVLLDSEASNAAADSCAQ